MNFKALKRRYCLSHSNEFFFKYFRSTNFEVLKSKYRLNHSNEYFILCSHLRELSSLKRWNRLTSLFKWLFLIFLDIKIMYMYVYMQKWLNYTLEWFIVLFKLNCNIYIYIGDVNVNYMFMYSVIFVWSRKNIFSFIYLLKI